MSTETTKLATAVVHIALFWRQVHGPVWQARKNPCSVNYIGEEEEEEFHILLLHLFCRLHGHVRKATRV